MGPTRQRHFVRLACMPAASSRGAKPADMPVMQSAKFEFVINLRTAKAQALAIPAALLALAVEVVE